MAHPAWRRSVGRRPSRGYAYLALLFAVVLIGAGLGGAAQVWHTMMQRERERQLLWVGHQYRQAIRLYVQGVGAGALAGGLAASSAASTPAADAGAAGQPAIAVTAPTGPQTDVSGQSPASGSPTTVPGTAGAGAAGAALPRGASRYPPTLDALVSDPRFQQIRRYLRKLYPDPITGKTDWVLILAPNGGIMGVRSLSEDEPLKQANFAPEDHEFFGKTHYSEWTFTYVPPQRNLFPNANVPPTPVPNYGPAPGVALPPAAPQP